MLAGAACWSAGVDAGALPPVCAAVDEPSAAGAPCVEEVVIWSVVPLMPLFDPPPVSGGGAAAGAGSALTVVLDVVGAFTWPFSTIGAPPVSTGVPGTTVPVSTAPPGAAPDVAKLNCGPAVEVFNTSDAEIELSGGVKLGEPACAAKEISGAL